MANRYVINLTDEQARKLERSLGGAVWLCGARLASVDAITDEEFEPIGKRLGTLGMPPLYHQGGPSGAT